MSNNILVFGDSMCAGLDIPNADIQSHPGFTTEELVKMDDIGLDMYLQEANYQTVVLMCGTNDIGFGICTANIIENIDKLVTQCATTPRIIIMGVINHSRDYDDLNSALFDYCEKTKTNDDKSHQSIMYCHLLEDVEGDLLHQDGVHLTTKGNKYISEQLLDFIINNQ